MPLPGRQRRATIASGPAKAPSRSTTSPPTWAAWGSSSASASSACGASSSTPTCSRPPGGPASSGTSTPPRPAPTTPSSRRSPIVACPQGIRRLSGHGRARLRLGEAHVRDVLPGILGGARHEDLHRPLPQRLRPQRHLGRRPGKGARGHLPQGHRGQGQGPELDRDLGRRRRGPAVSCTSTTASRAST